jgi:hypothetical protein
MLWFRMTRISHTMLQTLYSLAFRGAIEHKRWFHSSSSHLVPVTAENALEIPENDTETNFSPFSPSLTVAMQDTSVLPIKHEELGLIPVYLTTLPTVLRKMIDHCYVIDYKVLRLAQLKWVERQGKEMQLIKEIHLILLHLLCSSNV